MDEQRLQPVYFWRTCTAKQMSGQILRTQRSKTLLTTVEILGGLQARVCVSAGVSLQSETSLSWNKYVVFTRKINADMELSYWDRLKELWMASIQRRREKCCIIYTRKILEGVLPGPSTREETMKRQNHPSFGRICPRKTHFCVTPMMTVEAESFTNFRPRLCCTALYREQ